jgi:citrate synthase
VRWLAKVKISESQLPKVVTNIATSDPSSVTIRGRDLVRDLIGKRTFTEVFYFLVVGRFPTDPERRLLDACLVALVEHGLTSSALISRLTYESLPTELQVAVGSGLMAIGSVHAGTLEGCAAILREGADAPDVAVFCASVVESYRARKENLPGFGHRHHKPDDPRAIGLLQVAEKEGLAGPYVRLLRELSAAINRGAGRHITINATGAMAALLLEIGLAPEIVRGVAVVSRSAGLVGHILEERKTDSARFLTKLAKEHIPYEDPAPMGTG